MFDSPDYCKLNEPLEHARAAAESADNESTAMACETTKSKVKYLMTSGGPSISTI